MTQRRVLIADCDETILKMDLPQDGSLDGFSTAFSARITKLLQDKMTIEETQALFRHGYARINRTPQVYGWVRDGLVVASAADVLIMAGVVAGEILDSFEILTDRDLRRITIQRIFAESYSYSSTSLQPDAAMILNELRRAGWIVKVVTNAPTEKARKKLQDRSSGLPAGQSIDWLLEHVHGDAEKSKVTQPELSLRNPYLARPVFYHRPTLFELLDKLCRPGDDLTFLGDNADMDVHPGCERYRSQNPRGILFANSFTPRYDRQYFNGTPNRFLAHNWKEVASILLGQSF